MNLNGMFLYLNCLLTTSSALTNYLLKFYSITRLTKFHDHITYQVVFAIGKYNSVEPKQRRRLHKLQPTSWSIWGRYDQ